MKIHVHVDNRHRFTMGPVFYLVDENGNKIENASFVDWAGEKNITTTKSRDYTYITILIPTDDLWFEKGNTE